jgi:hypothetical protein
MSEPGYHDALRILCQDAGAGLHRVLAAACEPVPGRDPVVYLADFAYRVLVPLAAGAAGQEVAGTMAGRAFTTGRRPATRMARSGCGSRWWSRQPGSSLFAAAR